LTAASVSAEIPSAGSQRGASIHRAARQVVHETRQNQRAP
jgi:hypothetical protein